MTDQEGNFIPGSLIEMKVVTAFQPPGVTSWMRVKFVGRQRGHAVVELPDGKYLVCHEGVQQR